MSGAGNCCSLVSSGTIFGSCLSFLDKKPVVRPAGLCHGWTEQRCNISMEYSPMVWMPVSHTVDKSCSVAQSLAGDLE